MLSPTNVSGSSRSLHFFPTRRSSDLSDRVENLDALVNNAGIAIAIPLEFIPLGELRRQLDVNVVDRKSTRLNSSHITISYAVFCLKKKILYVIDDILFRSKSTRLNSS